MMQNGLNPQQQHYAHLNRQGYDSGGQGLNGQNINYQNMHFVHYKPTPEEHERSPIAAQINQVNFINFNLAENRQMGDQFLKNFQSPSQQNFQMRLNRQINESINLNPLTPLQGPMQAVPNNQALLTDGFNPKNLNQPAQYHPANLTRRHNKLPLLSKNPFSSGMLPSHRLQAQYDQHHHSAANLLQDPNDNSYHYLDMSHAVPLGHEDPMMMHSVHHNYNTTNDQYLNMNLQANQYTNANISMDHLNPKFK